MRKFRLTTRGLMIVVAVVAVAIGLGIQGRNAFERTRARRRRAEYHWQRARAWASVAERLRSGDEAGRSWMFKGGPLTSLVFLSVEWDDRPDPARGPAGVEDERKEALAECRARVDHHEAEMRLWDIAARRSWSADPIEPPPPPIRSGRLRVTVE